MKHIKALISTLLILALCFSFGGCCLQHEWSSATCDKPETCIKCGKTQGEPLGHNFSEATCTDPKICTVCKEKSGEPLGHTYGDWKPVSTKYLGYEEKRECTVCGESDTRQIPRPEKDGKAALNNSGLQMGLEEFAEHLIAYLPDGAYIDPDYEKGNLNVWKNGDLALISFDVHNNYKDLISVVFGGEDDAKEMIGFIAEAIVPNQKSSVYSDCEEAIRQGFLNGSDGVYTAESIVKDTCMVMIYIPSVTGHYPGVTFSTQKFANS